jgi:tripartite-type tricarboxylate transporter receptor subunit TctC
MPASLVRLILLLVGCLGMLSVATAQDALPKLVRIVVPFAAGGSNDVIARALAVPLAKRLDTTVIVENKPGAAGVVGSDFVAKSPRDGSVAAFVPVAMIGRGPMLLVVSATTPYKSPAELLAAARAKPGAINYGTAGVGSIAHLTTELMDDTAKIQMTHVPYKGASLAAVDLAAGQIQVMISNYSTVAPLMKSGKIRALAVTSDKPHPAFPDLPPLASVATGFNVDIWVGVFAPAGTPPAIVERLNREISAIAASPELAPVLEPDGALPEAIGSAPFAARLKTELGQWKQIATEHKIVAE